MGKPARGYKWEDFEPGNFAALKHGAQSPRTWQPIADRLVAELAESAPWTRTPAYASAVRAWGRVEAQLALVAAWLDDHGLLDDGGRPRPATNLADRLEARAARLRAELALTPTALVRVLRAAADLRAEPDAGGALDELLAEGRRALERGGGERRAG